MSLRARLLLATALCAIVALVAADVATYSALRGQLDTQVDQALEQSHVSLENAIAHGRLICQPTGGQGGSQPGGQGGPGGGPGGPPGPPQDLLLGTFVEVRSQSGAVVDGQQCPAYDNGVSVSPSLPSTLTGYSVDSHGDRVAYLTVRSATTGGPTFRVRASVLPDGDVLVLAVPLTQSASTLHRLLLTESIVTAAAILLALLLGLWLVRIGLRPLVSAERTAEAIAEGRLDERVPGESSRTEVGRLARALNTMLARIESAFAARDETEKQLRVSEARMRQFVGDASHELRTPIAAVGAYAELFERGASDDPADLARVMEGIRAETSRMQHLVEDLLTLARLDEQREPELWAVEVVGLAADAVRTSSTVGPEWPVELVAAEPVEVMADRMRLRQVLDNLLANVRAHTPAGTSAVVRVSRSENAAVIEVSDNGPGMDSDQVPHVFDRFFRADSSRTRSSGGAGLGLAIVAGIVESLGGTIAAVSSPGAGMAITIRLPLAPASED
ncbi:MAG TPA: HAMP domain-containing sensor histidine kinase [Acidimicrobiales bacterium]|nr:HAMP domain-containing sensor histidine kinase [Acidimicrobiales bacterium]